MECGLEGSGAMGVAEQCTNCGNRSWYGPHSGEGQALHLKMAPVHKERLAKEAQDAALASAEAQKAKGEQSDPAERLRAAQDEAFATLGEESPPERSPKVVRETQHAAATSAEAQTEEQKQSAEVSSPSRPSTTAVERTAPTPDLTGWGSREGALKVVAIGCAVMAVAAFLPWVSFRGRDVSFSLTGIEARGAEPFPADVGDGFFVGDGFVTLALGVYGLVLALVAIKRRWGRVLPLEPMSVGLFVLLLVVFEILDISGEPFASTGFGLVLTACSGLVVASASVLALIRPGDRPYRRINEEGAPCCWYCGGTAFHRKRVKWYFLRFGLFALFAKKRYKCDRCNNYNRPGAPVPLGAPIAVSQPTPLETTPRVAQAVSTPVAPEATASPEVAREPASTTRSDVAGELERLRDLVNEGFLTEEEANLAKRRILES